MTAIVTVLEVLGFACVLAGLYLLAPWSSLLVGGLGAIAAAVVIEGRRTEGRRGER